MQRANTQVQVLSQPTPAQLAAVRSMLDDAYGGEFSDEDWRHALGGRHVLITEAERVVSHASLVERRLICAGRSLRVGYVEAVATAASQRRRGLASLVMRRINALVQQRYELGALSTGVPVLYEASGWEPWLGPSFVADPSGTFTRTADDDGGILVLRTSRTPADLDPGADIVADWRDGDVW